MLHLQGGWGVGWRFGGGGVCVFPEVDVHLIKCQINCTMKDDSCVSGFEHSVALSLTLSLCNAGNSCKMLKGIKVGCWEIPRPPCPLLSILVRL